MGRRSYQRRDHLQVEGGQVNYDHITLAIESGGILTTSKNVHGIYSTMHRKGQEPICGDHHSTLPEALTSLNTALELDTPENHSE